MLTWSTSKDNVRLKEYWKLISVNAHIRIKNVATRCCSAAAACHLANARQHFSGWRRSGPMATSRCRFRGHSAPWQHCQPSLPPEAPLGAADIAHDAANVMTDPLVTTWSPRQ